MKNCQHCNVTFAPKRKEQIYCSHSCAAHTKGLAKRGRKLGLRAGWEYSVRTTDDDGYVRVYASTHPHANGRKMIALHVLLMEQEIGRQIAPSECVHHLNEDKTDNRLENLTLMTRAEHSRLHAKAAAPMRLRQGGRFAA